MLMGSRRRVMGRFTLRPWLMTLGWLASAVMAVAAISMFATWGS
jgi:Mn2+/Fe2+ NRAMP family transporter